MAGFEARSFRGCGVVTSEPFEVSDDNDSLQMLTRNSQVGEFYVMAPPQVKPKGENGLHTCDIMLFDEERDAHVRIGWREALNATLCGLKDGQDGEKEDSDFVTDVMKGKYGLDGKNVAGAKGTR